MAKTFNYITYTFKDGFVKVFKSQYGYINQAELFQLVQRHGVIKNVTCHK